MLVHVGIHGACVAADDESGCGEDASNGPPSLRGWSLTHCSFLPPARPYVGHACSLSCPITVPLLSTELGESPTTPSLSSVRWSVVADCLLACLSWLCGIREESKACYLVAYLSPPRRVCIGMGGCGSIMEQLVISLFWFTYQYSSDLYTSLLVQFIF